MTQTQRPRVSPDDLPVVATKLHIAAPPADRRARPELLARLGGAAGARLVLVSAPPGSGKTTLLGSWAAFPDEPRAFAWVSLDETDNDPVRFWGCVVAALRTVRPAFGADVVSLLRAPGGVPLTERVVPLAINELTELDEPIVLVLDDFHVIESPEILRSIAFLLDHLPPLVGLALASRTEPSLPLARLRARGELLELHAEDLRLSDDQATALLNGSLGLSLVPSEIAQLQSRTEGWAAGLQLVGLSLRGRRDSREYIESFAGDDRQIVDYLGVEVLERQTPETRTFLLRTAILDRLCGPLCDAVAGSSGSAEMLRSLERANLFLVALDGKRHWYRYHHLFGELLRHELARAEPELVRALHRRARAWFEGAGFVPEAIRHAIAAGDYGNAARLIAANWLVYVNRGELETVAAWTRALPPDAAARDPRLCLARAWMLLVLGRLEEVEPAVQEAEEGRLPGPMEDGSSSVEASAAMVRTSARVMLGDVAAATRTAAVAERLERDPRSRWRPIATNAMGMTAFWAGRSEDAREAFSETVTAAERVGNHTARIYALGYLAAVAVERGGADRADGLVEEALELAREHDLAEHWVTVMALFARAETALGHGDHEAAQAALARGLELARRAGARLDVSYGLLLQARLRRAAGSPAEAQEALAETRRLLAECADPGMMTARLARVEAALAGRNGIDDGLTARELEVLRFVASGLSDARVAEELVVSVRTVHAHLRSIYRKLGIASRSAATRYALERELV